MLLVYLYPHYIFTEVGKTVRNWPLLSFSSFPDLKLHLLLPSANSF